MSSHSFQIVRPSAVPVARARSRWVAALVLSIGLLLGGGPTACDGDHGGGADQSVTYYCPMHPTYTAKRPGSCPICSMTLVKRASLERAPATGERKAAYWYDAMEPSHHYDRPGKAPDGMDLVPFYGEGAAPAVAIEGRVPVIIPAERQQLIGVTTDLVRRVPLERSVRTVGRVAYDETRLQHVHIKFSGFVEHPYVDFTGAVVKQGDKLFEIYSPELLATQQEYLIAKRSYDQARGRAGGDSEHHAQELLQAARERLLLWDIPPSEIERLERKGAPERTLAIHSPYSGVVVERKAVHGMQVGPGDTVFAIADTSQVWVLADLYEYELPYVAVGQRARITLSYLSGRSWDGVVTFIAPTVEAKTRTVKVRLEFANPELVLKPDMFADVVMAGDLGEALVVPERAVIMTGLKSVVFVDLGAGRLEPRVVDLGTHLKDAYEVRGGLTEGERVVTSGNFLIDSESRLEAAVSGAKAAPEPPPVAPASAASEAPAAPAPTAGHAGHAGHGGGM